MPRIQSFNGESLYVIGRLLGYRHATTSNCCAHLDAAPLSDVAERVAEAIKLELCHS